MKRLALLLLLALTACGKNADEPWLGYGEGEDAFIAAPAPGWVASLAVVRGQEVKTGDLLFTLNDTREKAARDQAAANLVNIKAQMNQNQATVAYATKELTRQTNLVRASAGTQATLDLARSNYDQAIARISEIRAQEQQTQAALADAEYQLSQRSIVSLVNGRVEDIYFRAGEYVPPSTPVISVLPPQNVYVRFFVPETRIRPYEARPAGAHFLRWLRREHDGHHHLHRAAGRIHPARDLQHRQSREAGVQAGSARARRVETQSRPAGRCAAARER